jgi:hypothetical protein
MLTHVRRAIAITAVLAIFPLAASADLKPVLPSCPRTTKGNTWSKFLSFEYNPGAKYIGFTIRFDTLTKPIGKILPKETYSMMALRGGNWDAAGHIFGQKELYVGTFGGADPKEHKMNILGTIFTFSDDLGEVFDHDSNVVGTLRCNMGTDA